MNEHSMQMTTNLRTEDKKPNIKPHNIFGSEKAIVLTLEGIK